MTDRRRTGCRLLAAAAAIVLLLAGCANVPTSGLMQQTNLPNGLGGSSQGSRCCGLIIRPPQPGWSPKQIVLNFIESSYDLADHQSVARQYLTPSASASWHLGAGPAVIVIAQPPTVTLTGHLYGTEGTQLAEISVQEQGEVTGSGQYIPAPGGGTVLQQQFGLQQMNHQWRIASLPTGSNSISRELMLTTDLFQLAYQPHDLYFFDRSDKVLIPDPVFVPVDSADPGTDLAQALLANPQGWLSGAAFSVFPPAARLTKPVQIPPGSSTAVVDLSLPRSSLTRANLEAMSAQLAWTLTGSYGPQNVQAVKLVVNGRSWAPPGDSSGEQDRANYPQPVLGSPSQKDLYYLSAGAKVLRWRNPSPTPVAGAAGTARTLTSIAVSPDERYLAGIEPGPHGTSSVYTENLTAAEQPHASTAAGELHSRLSNGSFTAISWDRNDNLWVAGTIGGKPGMWMLGAASGTAASVVLPAGTGKITALRVAPDGVRIAMITGSGPGASVVLDAVVSTGQAISLSSAGQIGADLSDPSALTWYDADHVLVVNQSAFGPQLEEVPVNGGRSSYEGIEPDMVSVTAAGPHNDIYAGLQGGALAKSLGFGQSWKQLGPGRQMIYPG